MPDVGFRPESDVESDVVRITWLDFLLALVVGGLALFIYGRTVTPGLLPGDGGEFQTLAYLLGNTHPTGYPVYLTLARIFAFLPLGDLAYRINLFSAVTGALTVAGVYICGRFLTGYRAVSAASALALAISATFWSQSLIAEVYTAGAAFVIFILLTLLRWDRTNSSGAIFTAGLLGGLSIGVHMSVALLAPAIILFLLLHWRRGWPMWRSAVLGALSGLTITVLLFLLIECNDPTASYFNSVVEPSYSAWGYNSDQMDGVLEHLWFGWRGRQFQYLMFDDIANVMPDQANGYWDGLENELALPLVILAGLGAVWLLLHRPHIAVLLLSALFIQLLYFFNYEIWDLYAFFIPSYLLLTLLATAGMGALVDVGRWALNKLSRSNTWETSGAILDIIVSLLVLIFAVWPMFQPRQESLQTGTIDFGFDEYPQYDPYDKLIAAATVAELPQNAIVFTEWDTMWPYYYIAYLDSDRRDLAFVEAFPADDQENLADSLVDYVILNLGERPMFFERRITQLESEDNVIMGPRRIGPSRFFSVIEVEE
jgi:hypothetical protein